jgi:hypothetical protein
MFFKGRRPRRALRQSPLVIIITILAAIVGGAATYGAVNLMGMAVGAQ